MKAIAVNRIANRSLTIEEKLETGIQLTGPEIKSVRNGSISLKEGYGRIENNELFLHNIHISEYKNSAVKEYNPKRKRKLLLHKNQIKKLIGKQMEKGYTIIPLKAYFKNQWLKIEIGIGRGKSRIDRRQDIKKREAKIAIDRAIKKDLLKKK